MTSSNADVITRFYEAFAKRDAATMGSLYDESVTFSDAAFVDLKGKQVSAMWAMLLSREATVWSLEFSDVHADETTGSAKWTATYLFGPHKNKVVNHVTSQFTFREGKIVAQKDSFDFWTWASQALGPVGRLFGWSSLLHKSVQKNARGQLDAYMAKNNL